MLIKQILHHWDTAATACADRQRILQSFHAADASGERGFNLCVFDIMTDTDIHLITPFHGRWVSPKI